MLIKEKVYNYILNNVTDSKFESGGILGCNFDNMVTAVQLDNGRHFQGMKICSYYPDTDMLNRCIAEWSVRNIIFCGIFHTHFAKKADFSNGDLKYMKEILSVMPKEIDTVYFPLFLMPERKLIPFKAKLVDNQLNVTEDMLTIQN